jgi:DNA-binding Lrp family transcriptional regulator
VDDTDRQLLTYLQREIPLQSRPFEAIGKKLGLDSADVILRINRLRDEKVVRQISAIFEMERIGYQNVLAAAKVVDEFVDAAAAVICRHPGVPLCVKRRGNFNLWFVLALPPQEPLEEHLQRLQQLSGAQKIFSFRTLKVFKPAEAPVNFRENEALDLGDTEIHLVQMLQEDFPLTDEPYRTIAKRAGLTEELLFKQLHTFHKKGFFKRITAFTSLREKAAGNALILWRIPEEKIEAAGFGVASFPEVQVCTERSVTTEFSYALHAVVEAATELGCAAVLERIEQKIGQWPAQIFLKEKDYKRSRLKYFSRELQDWRMTQDGAVASGSL